MNNDQDIRWEQRFSNYIKALNKLSEAVGYIRNNLKNGGINLESHDNENVLEEIIREGLIQRFEYTYEMAWNVMKDYALFQGNSDIGGSRDAIRFAFSTNLISDGELWMDMIKSRIKTSHTYNEETANEIYIRIVNQYYKAFLEFKISMERKLSSQE